MIDFSTWRKAWALLEKHERRRAVVVVAAILLGAGMEAAMVVSVMPFLTVLSNPDDLANTPAIHWIYEAFGFSSNYGFLVAMALACIGVIVFTNLFLMLKTYIVWNFATLCSHTLSLRLLSAFLRQPYEFFLNRHSGNMAKGILTETEHVVGQFLMPAANLAASAFTVVAVLTLLLWINPLVASVCILALGSVYAGAYTLSRTLVKRLGQERVKANGLRFRVVNEALHGIKDIKILGREASYVRDYTQPSLFMARSSVAVGVLSEFPRFIVQTASFAGVIVLCLVLIDRSTFQSGESLQSIVPLIGVFAFAGQRMLPALQLVYFGMTQIRFGAAAVESVYDDLIATSSGEDLPGTPPPALGLSRELRLDDVSYTYPGSAGAGLSHVSLTIRKGEKIGIVGTTGAGKTTLADIVLGLIPARSGALRVDGTKVTDANVRAWQQSVGYVPQDIFLIDASFAQNIALGTAAADIDHDRVRQSAKLAQLHGFVTTNLPDGYATRVGDRGVRLSGGQRQRIGIARALYHDADLIVFDEATSALDNLTERDLMEAIGTIPGDKTILMIAHRLSTVRICDRILMLDRGRVTAFGTWDELMAQNEGFQRLARTAAAQ